MAGCHGNGRSNLRLIWPADPDERVSMVEVNGQKRAKYRLYTQEFECRRAVGELEIVETVDVDITPPRFMIEEYHPPEEDAFAPSSANKGEGYYTHLFSIAHHDETCCEGREATRNGELCLGLYREPGERDLEEIQRRLRLRDASEHGHRPGEASTAAELAVSERELKEWQESLSARRRQMFYQSFVDEFTTHKHRLFSDDPSVHSHGRFHFLSGHSRSGSQSKAGNDGRAT